jgi:hypothetical protein
MYLNCCPDLVQESAFTPSAPGVAQGVAQGVTGVLAVRCFFFFHGGSIAPLLAGCETIPQN